MIRREPENSDLKSVKKRGKKREKEKKSLVTKFDLKKSVIKLSWFRKFALEKVLQYKSEPGNLRL